MINSTALPARFIYWHLLREAGTHCCAVTYVLAIKVGSLSNIDRFLYLQFITVSASQTPPCKLGVFYVFCIHIQNAKVELEM